MGGNDIVFGDGAHIAYDSVGAVIFVESLFPTSGGDDVLDATTTRAYDTEYSNPFFSNVTVGAEVLIGGYGNDTLVGGEVDDNVDVLLGDNGKVTLAKIAAFPSVMLLSATQFEQTAAFDGIETTAAARWCGRSLRRPR